MNTRNPKLETVGFVVTIYNKIVTTVRKFQTLLFSFDALTLTFVITSLEI